MDQKLTEAEQIAHTILYSPRTHPEREQSIAKGLKLIEEYGEKFKTRWYPVDTMPKDGSVIIRWHTRWNCPIAVAYRPGISTIETCVWVTATLDNTWPEEAFQPRWQPLPEAPKP
jgi:hypothetical protein